jgi:hypothetical protein
MDENLVRKHAEAHGRAVMEREYERAADDLTDEAKANAGEVMRRLPQPITSADVLEVQSGSDEVLARIRYAGVDSAAVVESRWADRGGRPRIVELTVVEAT